MKLTEDRIHCLEAIGFKWILPNAQTKNTAVADQQCTSNNGGYTVSTSDCSCDDYSMLMVQRQNSWWKPL